MKPRDEVACLNRWIKGKGKLMPHQIPENAWQLYLETVNQADIKLREILNGKPMGPLLNQFLHILIFQQGICASRWINNNKDLIRRLNAVQSFTKDEFEELAAEVRKSVEKLVKTNT
jgi:hypothetical protein